MQRRIPVGWAAAVLAAAAWTVSAGELQDIPRGFKLVAQDNCGVKDQQSNLVAGANFAIPESNRPALKLKDERLFTAARGGRVALRYAGVFPGARYVARVFYYNPETNACSQTALAGGQPIAGSTVHLPPGKPVTQVIASPPAAHRRGAILDLAFKREPDGQAMVSAVELWSDRDMLMAGKAGRFIRFQVEAPLPNNKPITISDTRGCFPPQTITNAGLTPWIPLKPAGGVMIISGLAQAKGAILLGYFAPADDQPDLFLRRIAWDEPGAESINFDALLSNVFTLRDEERQNYRLTLEQTKAKLRPLTRPPLLFGNFWGYTEGAPDEYLIKTLRLMGMNCPAVTVIAAQNAKYARLYGGVTQGGVYQAAMRQPYDEEAVRAWQNSNYSNSHETVAVYQLSDEPREFGVNPEDPAANVGFRRWLAERGVTPKLFGQSSMDGVKLLLAPPKPDQATPETRRLYYWSRRYKAWLTPKAFALAAEAIKRSAANPDLQAYVGLSGHNLYLGRRRENVNPMPMDMFDLAAYPGLMPGISDWMSPYNARAGGWDGGQWRFVSHEAVGFSVAFFNAGARRYGADFGKPPVSRSMMHCVGPSLFRAYTMLGNQVKWISYYNYGPRVDHRGNGRVGAWSGIPEAHYAVQQVNNQAAQVDDLLGPGVMLPSRVALLCGRSTDYYGGDMADRTSRRDLFLALSHEYYKPELVTEEQVAEGALDHYSALYVVDRWVAAPAQERIAAWVRQGGLLWTRGGALQFNEFQEKHDFLERELGLKRADGKVDWPGARVRESNADGNPVWLEKELGRGRVHFLVTAPEYAYTYAIWPWRDLTLWYGGNKPELRAQIAAPLHEAKVERPLTVSLPAMMAAPIGTAAGTVIVFYNMNAPDIPSLPDVPRTNIVITLKSPTPPHSVQYVHGSGRDLEDLPHVYANGTVTMTLPKLPDYDDGLLIAVRNQPAPPDTRLADMRRNAEAYLASDDWQTLSAGAWFAGFFPEWGLGPKLAPLLKHENWSVRRSAAESLGRLKFAGAAADLRAALDRERDPHVLADLLGALDLVDHKDAPALAEKLAGHDNPAVSQEAAAILARRGR